jgi:hypothetical protein
MSRKQLVDQLTAMWLSVLTAVQPAPGKRD